MRIEMKAEEIASLILKAGALSIRDTENKEEPFLYASGNWGPGYVMIKGLVGQKKIIRPLIAQLAFKIAQEVPDLNFIAGNVTGGQIPGWEISEVLESILGRTIPYVYIRSARKKGGHKELITGDKNNPEILPGMKAVDVEELVNYAQTTCNAVEALRVKYVCNHAATILTYGNPNAVKNLKENNIKLIHLLTLNELLRVAEGAKFFEKRLIENYRLFLKDPLKWQTDRGYEPIKEGGTL